ncbi:MAG: hypothetical protein DWQ47_16515 [Acidobacteria bacterium]|nr:MAG: hypothetical protein DWQ32_03915 [Acidobacteriota bacterium]REK02347.1 MAG: hypothetical protein DWQ38_08225 [Acidobacteriota bacterium]REK13851.1 MAG: hypothetical protein DWQ43_09605 [Acidobacteriota bacterium]REK41846.1 MAG: hypothetical protein DWQ47_16515 [Acidobacteriota bacterium]
MQNYINVSGFEALLNGVIESGSWTKANCPAHDDQEISLSFREFSWGIAVKCASGCTTVDICVALKLDSNRLFKQGPNPFAQFDPVFSVKDFVTQEAPEYEFLVEDLLPSGGTSLLVAKPKVGKSILAIHLADCVARGIPFLGRKTNKANVFHLTLEGSQSQTQRRLSHTVRHGSQIDCYFGIPPQNRAKEWFEYRLTQRDYGLVIVDPMSKLINGSDYDNYALMDREMKFFVSLAQDLGPHIMLLHHEGKRIREEGDGVLGSSAIFGAADSLIALRKQNNQRTIFSINRYGEDIPKSILSFDRETRAIEVIGTVTETSLMRAKEKVQLLLADGAKRTEKVVKEGVSGHSNGEVSKALRILVEEGTLYKSGTGKRNDPGLYWLAGVKEDEEGEDEDDDEEGPNMLDLINSKKDGA